MTVTLAIQTINCQISKLSRNVFYTVFIGSYIFPFWRQKKLPKVYSSYFGIIMNFDIHQHEQGRNETLASNSYVAIISSFLISLYLIFFYLCAWQFVFDPFKKLIKNCNLRELRQKRVVSGTNEYAFRLRLSMFNGVCSVHYSMKYVLRFKQLVTQWFYRFVVFLTGAAVLCPRF